MTEGAWKEQEKAFLRDHAGELSADQIGARLGRTTTSVRTQASRLGVLVGLSRRRDWSSAEDDQLRALWTGDNAADTAIKVGRSRLSVIYRVAALGLPLSGDALAVFRSRRGGL